MKFQIYIIAIFTYVFEVPSIFGNISPDLPPGNGSLFDQLPLNGAYSPTLSRDPQQQLLLNEPEDDGDKPKILNKDRQEAKGSRSSSTTVKILESQEIRGPKRSSLFDTMPDQGALPPSGSSSQNLKKRTIFGLLDKKTQKRSFFQDNNGNTDWKPMSSPGPSTLTSSGVQFEVQQIFPSTEIRLPTRQRTYLSPIVAQQEESSPSEIQQQVIIGPPVYSQPSSLRSYIPPTPAPAGLTPGAPVPVAREQVTPPPGTRTLYLYDQTTARPTPKVEELPREVHHHYYTPEVRIQSPSETYGPPPSSSSSGNGSVSPGPTFPIITGPSGSRPTFNSRVGSYSNADTGYYPSSTSYETSSSSSSSYWPSSSSSTASDPWYPPPPTPVREPTQSYGPPAPPVREPSQSYGPPSPLPPVYVPSQNYGPPAPPAPPPLRPKAPTTKTTTSISYQTVPVQTVSTQLVTVPHVTVTSSAEEESQLQDQPVEDSLAGGYGSPSNRVKDQGTTNVKQTGPSARSLFTDDQISALLSVTRGAGDLQQNDFSGSFLTSPSLNLNYPDLKLGGSASSSLLNPTNTGILLGQLTPQPVFRTTGSNNNRNTAAQVLTLLTAAQRQRQVQGQLSLLQPGLTRGSNSYGPPVVTRDAVNIVSDLIREQQLAGALAELRGQLRYERSVTRARAKDRRALFFKGALLLGALSLVPKVMAPMAVVTGGAPLLVPLAVGRKRRGAMAIEDERSTSIFEGCPKPVSRLSGPNNGTMFKEWLECATGVTEDLFHIKDNSKKMTWIPSIPKRLQLNLAKSLTTNEILESVQCIQKLFCHNLLEIESLPNPEPLLLLYSIFGSNVQSNPWIQRSMKYAKMKSCSEFNCPDLPIKKS